MKWTIFLGLLGTLVFTGATEALACRLNSDCPIWDLCESGVCVAVPPCTDPVCPCYADADCSGAGEVCDRNTLLCFVAECFADPDCPLGERCGSNLCIIDLEADRDRDGVPDGSAGSPVDNCPADINPGQQDTDGDGMGDTCDSDDDADGVHDNSDNCQWVYNPEQNNNDGDARGSACDLDDDNDGDEDAHDNCPGLSNDQADGDKDGVGDACDLCPYEASPNRADTDNDGLGDPCDPDKDGDSVRNFEDNCPGIANTDQADCDCNGIGDACSATPCGPSFCIP